ncbi:flagellar hook assembly protein FlgD [Georhizobium profundi]|jgi:flagellar basal-body rod modification protein FlgD|uniref:Basal-body rod modification protein FlgD n=1 Tax=Georhizobium profundi TaxID=2341112 RepID=A0A3S9B1T7_9HYPH|nr:flagellar hook assembly protein FlgD [Georhizobium profundi]AZN70880.1 flagellar hook assembly protein FlgD [Georhizobium profundi]
MEIGATGSATTSTAATSKSQQASENAMLDYDNFLQLLVAQMRNQDPTEPMDSTQQIAQLATFSQVEQTIQTNRRLEMLLQSSALSEANAVIGRTLTSTDGLTSGVVKEVLLRSDGITAILEDGKKIDVTSGVSIS